MSSYGYYYLIEFNNGGIIEIYDPNSPNNINVEIIITTNIAPVDNF